MGSLSTPLLVIVFLAGAAATWVAGIRLSGTTDALDARFGLGEELGGILLLAVAGTLPELAITVSGAARGNLDLAAGNLIGGIAVQRGISGQLVVTEKVETCTVEIVTSGGGATATRIVDFTFGSPSGTKRYAPAGGGAFSLYAVSESSGR